MAMTDPGREYRWTYPRKGATARYHNLPPADFPPHLRRKAKTDPRHGRQCPTCGLTRSVANKCECNS